MAKVAREAQTVTDRRPLLALFVANTISQIGNQFTFLAIPWFVLQTTGSASKTGISAFFTTLPMVLSGFFGGILVDRLGYKRTSVLCDLASGLIVAVIPLLHQFGSLAFWQLLVLVSFRSLLTTPGQTARASLRPELAALAGFRLEQTSAASTAIAHFSGVAGPALAGLLIVVVGASNVLWFDSGSFLVSAAVVALAIPSLGLAQVADDRTERSYRAALIEGWTFLRRHHLLRALLITSAVGNLLGASFFSVLMPVYAARVFGSATDLGLILTAFSGGALAGSLLFGILAPRLSRRIAYATAVLFSGLPVGLLALTSSLGLTLFLIVIQGLAFGPINVLLGTVPLEQTPPGLRGRIGGINTALGWVTIPSGTLLMGYLIAGLGVRPALLTVAAINVLMTIYIYANPAFREMAAPAEPAGDCDREYRAGVGVDADRDGPQQ